jgi:heat shock protein HslJ
MKLKPFALLPILVVIALSVLACSPPVLGPSDPLRSTSWELMAYRKSRPIEGTTITAVFEEGQVRGSSGCNTYFGSYEVSGDSITVGPLAMTEMACLEPEGAMEQEMYYLEFLMEGQTFRLSDDRLEIFRSDGEALTFVPQG